MNKPILPKFLTQAEDTDFFSTDGLEFSPPVAGTYMVAGTSVTVSGRPHQPLRRDTTSVGTITIGSWNAPGFIRVNGATIVGHE